MTALFATVWRWKQLGYLQKGDQKTKVSSHSGTLHNNKTAWEHKMNYWRTWISLCWENIYKLYISILQSVLGCCYMCIKTELCPKDLCTLSSVHNISKIKIMLYSILTFGRVSNVSTETCSLTLWGQYAVRQSGGFKVQPYVSFMCDFIWYVVFKLILMEFFFLCHICIWIITKLSFKSQRF